MDPRYSFGLLIIVGAVVVRIAMHFFDKNRIKDEVEAKLGASCR